MLKADTKKIYHICDVENRFGYAASPRTNFILITARLCFIDISIDNLDNLGIS